MQAHNPHSTAILVFARSSQAELQHKPFAKGGALFEALTARTLRTVQKTQLPFYHFTEAQQDGASFGERFANAIQAVFDKGYESVITVGNDSPNLEKAHLDKALFKLEQKASVIGPSADGGFYLMGIHRSNFEKSDFKRLSWQTTYIKEEVIGVLNANGGSTFMLPTLFDIDTYWDAKTIDAYAFRLDSMVRKALLALIKGTQKIAGQPVPMLAYTESEIYFNKGSPTHFPR